MKASTHTEIYRPFKGELRARPLRFLTIAWSGIRLSFRKKLPLLLLFVPPWITSIVFCFLVHLKFQAESGQIPGLDGQRAQMLGAAAGAMLQVSQLIVNFVNSPVLMFAILAIAWYGAGLIAEDRRLGANLLYFSRPITRLDYLLGKFVAAASYGCFALLVPALMICGIAAFSSPNWSFLTEQWDVILKTLGFCSVVICVITALVLCVSSLVERKSLALVGVFGFVFLLESVSRVLWLLTESDIFRVTSLVRNLVRISNWMFDQKTRFSWPVESSWIALGVLFVVSLAVLARRVRHMEVVA
jgi:ABC-2 type transport system permease protein